MIAEANKKVVDLPILIYSIKQQNMMQAKIEESKKTKNKTEKPKKRAVKPIGSNTTKDVNTPYDESRITKK